MKSSRRPDVPLHSFGSLCGDGSKWPGRAIAAASVAEIEEAAVLMRHPIPGALWEELRHEGLLAVGIPTPA